MTLMSLAAVLPVSYSVPFPRMRSVTLAVEYHGLVDLDRECSTILPNYHQPKQEEESQWYTYINYQPNLGT